MDSVQSAILAPLRLLAAHALAWAPVVIALSWVAALPEIIVSVYLPEMMSVFDITDLDPELLMAGVTTLLLVLCGQLVVQLLALMLVFVILADITSGRPVNVWAGLGRLASWRLQGVWIVAGIIEQAAISLWFVGGGLLLVPFGLVTTLAYEEKAGLGAFSRSRELAMREGAGTSPGAKLAIGVTLVFFVYFIGSTAVTVVSCARQMAGLITLDTASLLTSGLGQGAALPAHTWQDSLFTLLRAPFALLPTVYMMTAQQMTYWSCVRNNPVQA